MANDLETVIDQASSALADQAKALSVVLRNEFKEPFAFFSASAGELVWNLDPETEEPIHFRLPPEAIVELARDGRASVIALDDNCYQLSLLLYQDGLPGMIAVGVIKSLYADGPGSLDGVAREVGMLRGWLQSFSDRLRLTDQLEVRRRGDDTRHAQANSAWEALLAVDQVARQLRLNKVAARNHDKVLDAAFEIMSARSLVYVPLQAEEPVQHRGEALLTAEQARQLVGSLAQSPDLRAPAPMLCNQVSTMRWGSRFPQLQNLVAFLIKDQGPMGWLLALNKKDGSPFRRSDAALLLPFAGLLELHLRSTHRYQDLKDLLVGLTRSLTTALDAKDAYTFGHSERVARIAVELGREMGLESDELGDLYLAGLLHDVGKIGIKDTVLHKKEALTPEEREHIQQHVTIGYWILADLRQIRNLLPGVLYHHERYDGKGYPDGLAAEDIPLLARILAVADSYDAMSHQRPYRDSMPYRRVEEILLEGAGSQWDNRVVEAFLRCRQRVHAIRQRGVGDSLRQAIDGALRSDTGSHRHAGAPITPLGLLSSVITEET